MTATVEQYLVSVKDNLSELAYLPFEHVARNRNWSDFLARLAIERNALTVLSTEVSITPRFILVACAQASLAKQVLFSAFFQNHPAVAVLLLRTEDNDPHVVDLSAIALARPDGLRIETCSSHDKLPSWVNDSDYLIPFGDGDVLHPALACTIALRSLSPESHEPDVWSWNATCYSLSGHRRAVATGFVRKPGSPDLSWMSGDVLGRAFAVRAGVFRTIFPEGVGALNTAGLSQRAFRLAIPNVQWQHHPEYMGLYRASGPETLVETHHPSHCEADDILKFALDQAAGTQFEAYTPPVTNIPSERRPLVQPRLSGDGVSVIIPFRDKAELTLQAVASVLSQTTPTWIELILIDNQSQPFEIERLRDGLDLLHHDNARIRILNYPHPFNHSRQCNIGARVAGGETLVFLNNDAIFKTPDVLDTLARWSGVPSVASVGPRIVTPSGELQCAGFKARQSPGFDYNSPVEESRDPFLSTGLREVVGNSFACAAVRRARFFELGALDEIAFPAGYNDVDYCLRAKNRGCRHLLVGWVYVAHAPGSSRGTSDEILQKVLIRERYPQVLHMSQYQLESDPQMLEMSLAKRDSQLDPIAYSLFW